MNHEANATNRVLARQLATEIDAEMLEAVTGGLPTGGMNAGYKGVSTTSGKGTDDSRKCESEDKC